MTEVVITTTVMGFSLPVDNVGGVKNTHVNIMRYAEKFIHRSYDKPSNQWLIVNQFFYYDRIQQRCYFPRYDLENFKTFLTENAVRYTVIDKPGEEGKPAKFEMLPFVQFKNDKQKGCVEFITNPEVGPLRAIALQTGAGKTVSFIMGLQRMKVRSMITMTSRLDQWVKEFGSYSTIDESELYVVQGVASLTKLFSLIDKELKPKCILMSTKTMRLYIDYGPSYQHLPHPSEMCEKLGIGIVASDENHEHFYTNFLIGIILNPALFIPITATFLASDPFVKNILNQFIPKDIQFTGGEYQKYVNVTAYRYTSGGYLIKPHHYMGRMGYSQQIFEKFLMGKGRKILDNLVNDAILPIISEHYVKIAEPGERFLFLCSSTKLCDHLATVFKRVFKDKTVSVFYAGMPETILSRYDIILSTPGSAGTGRDIKNLRTCFAFENVDSETRNLQFIGRLRGPPQMMNTPEFVYLYFSCIKQHEKYAGSRAMLYGPRALTFKHRTIS